MANYSAYPNPYATPYGTVGGIRSLKESIHGLSQDYLRRKQKDNEMAQAIEDQARRAKQAELEHTLAITTARTVENEKTRRYEDSLKDRDEREKTAAITRGTLEARTKASGLSAELSAEELKETRYLNEMVPTPKEYLPLGLKPTITRRELNDLVADKLRYIKDSPLVIEQKQREDLLKKLNAELKAFNPTGQGAGYQPNSSVILNFAKRIKEQTGGERELVPVKWVQEQGYVRQQPFAIPGEEPVDIPANIMGGGKPETVYQPLEGKELSQFRSGKYVPESGVTYGYLIQPISSIPESEEKPHAGTAWTVYPFGKERKVQSQSTPANALTNALPTASAVTARPEQVSTIVAAPNQQDRGTITTPNEEERANRIFNELNRAGVQPSRQDLKDIFEDKISVRDYIRKYETMYRER